MLMVYTSLQTYLFTNTEENNIIFLKFGGVEIWAHYKRSRCDQFEQCQICTKILKCDVGSTKGLQRHLKTGHNIDLLKCKIGEGNSLNNKKKLLRAVRKLDFND